MKINVKKITAILLIIVMVTVNAPLSVFASDPIRPSIAITEPSRNSVNEGESVSYIVYFGDNIGITSVPMDSSYVVLNGFTGNVSVTGSGNSQRTVTITNIQGSAGSGKTVYIKAGAARDEAGNQTGQTPNTVAFTLSEVVPVYNDNIRPSISITTPSRDNVKAGESVSYIVYFGDNIGITSVPMNSSYVGLNGFTGNVSVTGSGNSQRTVTITNIQGSAGSGKTVYIKAGAARDEAGNQTLQTPNSVAFTLSEVVPVYNDNIRPSISITTPSRYNVKTGESVSYIVYFGDNIGITSVPMDSSYVGLNGFTGNVSVTGSGNSQRTVTITNIQGSAGSGKTVYIKAGAARDGAGNQTGSTPNTIPFEIVKKTVIINPVKPPVKPIITIKPVVKFVEKSAIKPIINNNNCIEAFAPQNCNDFINQMGDINNEITYFSSWLRSEKYTSQYVQENNYVAKDETMTYMIEYYNGSTAPMPSVSFELNIPYSVVIEEINGNGRATVQSATETKIEWNVGRLETGARCRLYARVRFTGDSKLEQSKDISKVFYAGLKTTAGGNTSYSYMRQLYIDKNPNKVGESKRYLTTIDNKNEIRPDDQITRAEFAKILADTGIVEARAGSEEYKTFKDSEEIPAYAREAVSALVGKDIIQAYPDGEFKPNNPILREDLMQMVAQAARYLSDTKLTIVKPTFIYTSALKDENNEITEKKDYIMELMRQNVVVKYESKPDKYAKRKEAVEILNSLTFRGPFVERLPASTIKYSDIREDSNYFYNMISATNSYKYKYDYRLRQEIIEINN